MSLLSYREAQHWPQYSRHGLTNAERQLNLLAMLFPLQPRRLAALFTATAHCWLSFLSIRTPRYWHMDLFFLWCRNFMCLCWTWVPLYLFLQPVKILLNDIIILRHLSHCSQLCIVHELAEGAVCHTTQNFKQCWPHYQALGKLLVIGFQVNFEVLVKIL